jgi:hypothetical protein
MIDVKKAVAIASISFKDLLSAASDITLEEVELSEDDRFWYITLSALIPAEVQPSSVLQSQMNISPIAELFRPGSHRVYKIFTIDAETGSVKSMKIRKAE